MSERRPFKLVMLDSTCWELPEKNPLPARNLRLLTCEICAPSIIAREPGDPKKTFVSSIATVAPVSSEDRFFKSNDRNQYVYLWSDETEDELAAWQASCVPEDDRWLACERTNYPGAFTGDFITSKVLVFCDPEKHEAYYDQFPKTRIAVPQR